MSIQVSSPFDGHQPRPQTHQGVHSSPCESPRIQRPASQASLHLAPANAYSPSIPHLDQHQPMTAYPAPHQQPMRHFQTNISLPSPHQQFLAHPASAPPVQSFMNMYDARGLPTGMRPVQGTVSHAHPMNSATEHTASSRWSSSPHSAHLDNGPPTASAPAYQMHQLQHQPSFTVTYPDHGDAQRHINPMLTLGGGQSMSRSTSGASDSAADYSARLLTPFGYRDYQTTLGSSDLSPNEQDIRKVSDSLGRANNRLFSGFMPNFELTGHALSNQPHPQPEGGIYFGRGGNFSTDFAVSSERHDIKPDVNILGVDTEYERERAAQIQQNRKTLESLGLGNQTSHVRSRNASNMGNGRHRKASTPLKKRIGSVANPVRASPRIASMSRNVSYAHLDGGEPASEDEGEDEYESDQDDMEEEDEFRPSKKARGHKHSYNKKASYNNGYRAVHRPQLSLWGLLQVYPEIPQRFPLFYYTLNNDLTINSDSVPLIGSIPSTVTPSEKAEILKTFFQRGKRVLAQLDSFTSRCDRKWEGPEPRWNELEFHTRVAVRDVRRKVVERCENYKYTRRDILDKIVGKNKWPPIETGLIEWRPGMTTNDPAGDLANVTLTLPTPPPGAYVHQNRPMSSTSSAYPDRAIRPFPSHSRTRMPSSAGIPRTVSINMSENDHHLPHQPYTAAPGLQFTGYGYPQHNAGPPPPMYGEDEVPMSVQMPNGLQTGNSVTSGAGNGSGSSMIVPGSATLAPGEPSSTSWNGMQQFDRSPLQDIPDNSRANKRAHSDDGDLGSSDVEDNDGGNGEVENKEADIGFPAQSTDGQWNGTNAFPVA